MTTTLEYLPDEILLHICQYLSQYYTILAFAGLNNRLNCTISQYFQTLVVSSDTYYAHLQTCKLLSIIGPYLRSLTIKDVQLSSADISLASNIQELTFIRTKPDHIPILSNLTDLNVINGPSFQSIDVLFSPNETLHSVYIASTSPLKIPIFSPRKFSTIKQLAVTVQSLDDFVHLLYICPELTCLNLVLQTCNFSNIEKLDNQLSIETPSTLRSFSLRTPYDVHISFNELKYIFKHLTSRLEHIAIETYTEDIACVDGQQWETYLEESLPELNHFEFFILLNNEHPNESNPLHLKDILKTFQSAYLSLIIPQKITGYYNGFSFRKSICIHTEIIPTVRRRRYFLY